MKLNRVFELSMVLNADHFQRIFDMAYDRTGDLKEAGDEFVDTSLSSKGITVLYRDSQYKKKVRLLINTNLIVVNASDTDKLIRKLDKRITGYFNHEYTMDDFTLSDVTLTLDINVGSREKVSDYLKVLQRVGKVKSFSPISYDCFDEKDSFCLTGNSNDTDFLLHDLEAAVMGKLRNADAGRKQLQVASEQTKGILRAEVRLTKPKATRVYTDAEGTADQIIELSKKGEDVFLDTFTRIVPFGDFYKKDKATEIVWHEVKDSIMRRRMLRLLTLIPEKKSVLLAQKAMNCRDVEKVMMAFAKINLSPVTVSKRHDIKKLENLYSYLM